MECGDLEFLQVEPLAQHVHADHDPRLAGDDPGADVLALGLGRDAGVDLDGVELRVLAVTLEDFLGPGDVAARAIKMCPWWKSTRSWATAASAIAASRLAGLNSLTGTKRIGFKYPCS